MWYIQSHTICENAQMSLMEQIKWHEKQVNNIPKWWTRCQLGSQPHQGSCQYHCFHYHQVTLSRWLTERDKPPVKYALRCPKHPQLNGLSWAWLNPSCFIHRWWMAADGRMNPGSLLLFNKAWEQQTKNWSSLCVRAGERITRPFREAERRIN